MDFRNLCSKLDVDAIRAKIPPLPQIKLPKSMSKLKSRKIFRSSRENINSVSRRTSSKRKPSNSESLPIRLGAPGLVNHTPNRISTISSLMNQEDNVGRVSSKWKARNSDDENFYYSAGGIEDYYPSPLNERLERRMSRPISPIKAPPITQEFRAQSEQNIKMSLGDKLQKGYKDMSEFKLKHLFAKRTVVRTDKIEITEYIHRFDEDRLHEEKVQRKLDRDIADNYRFRFKVSQQKSTESYVDSPGSTPQRTEHKRNHKTVSDLSGDESGMESSPPPRKPGIASTRFSRVRHTPLNMSLEETNADDEDTHVIKEELPQTNLEKSSQSRPSSQISKRAVGPHELSEVRQTSVNSSVDEGHDYDNESDEDINDIELNVLDVESPKIKANASSLYDIKKHKASEKSTCARQSTRKTKSIKERMTRLTKQKSEGDEKKRSPQKSEEIEGDSAEAPIKSDKPLETIKQNFKRLQKSIRLPQQKSMSSEAHSESDEVIRENKTILAKTQQLSERIKRFRSTEQINKNDEDDETKESPMHRISNKLQEWKKSLKKKVDSNKTDTEDVHEANSPQKPIESLMKKLRHIKSHKHDSTEDPDDDEEGGETYKESLAARAKLQLEKGVAAASQVPQKTIKRISDTKKYFQKKQEKVDKNKREQTNSEEEEIEEEENQTKMETKTVAKSIQRPPPKIPRPYLNNSSEEEDTDDNQAFIAKSIAESQLIAVPTARAVWTTKPILSDDATDYEDEFPRVLLHQDNSDVFESTLIIAVTCPISRTTTPIITELPPEFTEESIPDAKPLFCNQIQDIGAASLEMTPPSPGTLSKESNNNTTTNFRTHSREHSVDSSSEDSWIKDIPRGPSTAVIDSIIENDIPWKIQKGNSKDNLYKTKSIDLFEMQKKHGGVLTAFEDFDDELKNTPVVKIENENELDHKIPQNIAIYERESSEDLENPDDDNSSRVTKISVPPSDANDTRRSVMEQELKSHTYGNSRENLTGNLDESHVIGSDEEHNIEENYESYDTNNLHDVKNEQPLHLKFPTSSTPPPLPQRQPIITISQLDQACPSEPPPPLPTTKPPIVPNKCSPPKIPDRNPIKTRISKPLVKTASLRLAYSEQVNPEDVGKVNKLISRFEPDGPKQKPRITLRKPWTTTESEEYSDEEDSFEIWPQKQNTNIRDTTPTNYPRIQKSFSIESIDSPNNNKQLSTPPNRHIQVSLTRKATSQTTIDSNESVASIPSISISSTCLDINSNFSQPSSIYGSPLPYPSSLDGSTEVTPLTNRKDSDYLRTRRNRRSIARDDEHFYSFDSDEENSYYSISPTSSHRYVVEL